MKRSAFSAVGISSLLVIFAVLCLAVFAMLSVSTAQAQNRLAENSQNAIAGYYKADCEAEEILASLRGGKLPEGVAQNGDIFTYACRISDTQLLYVSVKMSADQYAILQWQAISSVDWEVEDKLPVWDGQMP